ncbi:MAG: 2-C-methyl-D-erythritol 2,4-cyclodiphosphate synthase [Tannerella sp.]|jgi:2-C-methyl-D-erythritol 2,4-cyclodiphosphate synthase|nr:2-C-methyl-D-erythritol 2,4-cyclodiphosphate synthase [Tannerella sp.]
MRIGFGYDVHAFAEGRELWLGGVKIDYPLGLQGHSDADVLIHAVCDALLGAANMRDIGYHFPDSSPQFKNIDSKILLRETMQLLRNAGYELGNMDATVIAEQPKLSPYIPQMQKTLAETMQVPETDVSIKATTSEKMGFVGRKEGIAVCAVALIINKQRSF